MTTQKEVRASFWENYPEFKHEYRAKKRQNDYYTDIRVSFCEHIETLRRSGEISEKLAERVTL